MHGPLSVPLAPNATALTLSLANEHAQRVREQHLARRRLWRQRCNQAARAGPINGTSRVGTTARERCRRQIWDEFLDDDTKRVRGRLRQLLPTMHEIKALIEQQQQLHCMISEHQLASDAIHRMVSTPQRTEWDEQVQRWKALARVHFRPWTPEQCIAALTAAMIETDRLHIQPRRAIDGSVSTRSLQGLDYYASTGWRVYMETDLYNKVVVGRRGTAVVSVLQELTPQLSDVLYHERYDGVDINFHSLNLLATVETKCGVTQFIRSIEAPDLLAVFNCPDDTWVSKFYWKQFDILDSTKPRETTDFCMSLRGSIRGNDRGYANRWMFDVLGSVVRDEL